MKNLLTKSLWYLIAVALITSCSQEHDILSNHPVANAVISASSDGHSSPYTRTQVGGVANDGSLVIQWSANDKIGVFGKSVNNVQFTSTNSAPSDKADFNGSLAATAVPEKAYYPYNENVSDITAIPITIPTKQIYKDVTSLAAYDFKAAASCDVLGNGTYHMNFRQVATMLRLNIELQGVEGLATDEKVNSVNIEIDGYDLSGSYTYDLNNLDSGLNREPEQGSDLYTWVDIELANKPLVSDNVTAYAVIAPGATKGAVIRINITTDKHKATFSTNLLGDIRAGVFYDLPLTATVINSKADLKIEEIAKPNPDPTPGEEETANCYMINTTGEHDFCATQIGNGDKGIIPGAGFHVTSSKINPKSAKLMWQDVENFIDASSIRLENGRVHYTANKNSGNAMIAVYSGENCTGDILWSWHIWGVGDTMPGDDEVTNRAGAKFKVMNRTLGTHSAMSQYATLYQWGRKDPFPNTDVYYKADGTAVDISRSFPIYTPSSVSDASIMTSVKKCDQIIEFSPAQYDWNWLSADNQYLWGDTNIDDEFTWKTEGRLTNSAAGAGWTHGKTIYDPSPVGYRVANRFTFTGFSKLDNGEVKIKGSMGKGDIDSEANILVEYFIEGKDVERYRPKFVNGVFVGYFFKNNDTDMSASFYPMVGNRNNTEKYGTQVGVVGGYYVSSPQKNRHSATYFNIYKYEWLDVDIVGGAAGNRINYDTMYFGSKVETHAIRCVREK